MNRLTLSTMVSVLICLAAWWLPTMSGSMSYSQFMLALLLSAISLTLITIWFCPTDRRRKLGFRVMAIWMGIAIAVGIWEMMAFVLPTKSLADNPWYISTGEGLVDDRDLPWVRPPHLSWTGSSRGDLAMETNSRDPEARVITFQTDFQGFRNSQDIVHAEIVFIGDSFTEAGNVPEEETFVWLTGQRMDAVVRNLGVAGYGPPAELVILEKFGLQCQPGVVVWQLTETNDLDDSVYFVQWQQAGRPSVLPGFSKAQPTHLEGWQRRSPTHLLYGLLPSEEPWPFCGDFIDRDGVAHLLRFEMSFPPDAGRHPGWPIVAFSIESGARILRQHNTQLVVMFIPRKLRVMAAATDFHEITLTTPVGPTTVKHSLPAGWDLHPDARLAGHLGKLCRQLQVTFVDTTNRLAQSAGEGDLVYQSMDTHLSPIGHQVVADMLVEAISAVETEGEPEAATSNLQDTQQRP